MQQEGIQIIGGTSGYTEIIISDDFQGDQTEEGITKIEENRRIIEKLEKQKITVSKKTE